MRFRAEFQVTRREVDAAGGNQATNGRKDLLKFAAASGLLLTFRINRIGRNRSTATTASPATTRTAAATGPATTARSATAALPAPTASSSASARTAACIAAAARATPAARRRRAGRYATCRRIHAVRIRFAEGINRRKNHQGDHRREQRVLGRILSRFLPPDSFEECLHHGVFDSKKPAERVPTNCLHSFIAFFQGNCNGCNARRRGAQAAS